MVIQTSHDIPAQGTPDEGSSWLAPRGRRDFPGILLYSDIFQLTGPMLRAVRGWRDTASWWRRRRFTTASSRRGRSCRSTTPAGSVAGRRGRDPRGRFRRGRPARRWTSWRGTRASPPAGSAPPGSASAGTWRSGPRLAAGRPGHGLLLRARASTTASSAGTPTPALSGRAGEIRGELLLVFGTRDPHVPDDARATIDAALRAAGTAATTRLYPAEHAFMRDEGPRHDPEATDLAFAEMVALFRRALAG